MSIHRLSAKAITSNEMESELQSILSKILSVCSPYQVWLFGSLASDSFTEASDIDLAVIANSASEVEQTRKSIYGLGRLSEWAIDLLFFDRVTFEKKKELGGVCMIIAEEGRTLYPRGR